jgi:hypothetical protein
MAGAVTTLRELFRKTPKALTLSEISVLNPTLKPNEIQMGLLYLIRQRYAIRELIANPKLIGREKVWSYTYFDKKQPKEAL